MTLLLLFTILYGNIFVMMHLHEAHIYIISVCINKMLISQLKRFLCVNLCFHLDSNLVFISHFYAVVIHIITFQNTRCAGDAITLAASVT